MDFSAGVAFAEACGVWIADEGEVSWGDFGVVPGGSRRQRKGLGMEALRAAVIVREM